MFARLLAHSTEVRDLSEGLEGLGVEVSAPSGLLYRQDHAVLDQGLRAQAFHALLSHGDLVVSEPDAGW